MENISFKQLIASIPGTPLGVNLPLLHIFHFSMKETIRTDVIDYHIVLGYYLSLTLLKGTDFSIPEKIGFKFIQSIYEVLSKIEGELLSLNECCISGGVISLKNEFHIIEDNTLVYKIALNLLKSYLNLSKLYNLDNQKLLNMAYDLNKSVKIDNFFNLQNFYSIKKKLKKLDVLEESSINKYLQKYIISLKNPLFTETL